MKACHFKAGLLSWFFAATMISNFLLVGCDPPTQTQLVGRYVRFHLGVTDSILLNGSGTFKQDVTFTNGETWSSSGSWKMTNRVIQLDKCYLTFDDEKQSIIIPPQVVYSCTFSVSAGKLMRTELQPPWSKTNLTNSRQ
jgi:hypothetical protein